MGSLKEYYQSIAVEPYQAVYMEFRGKELNEVVDGFAAAYDGLIRVSEVLARLPEPPDGCE